MRVPRLRNRRNAWILLCCLCLFIGFIQINSIIYEYPGMHNTLIVDTDSISSIKHNISMRLQNTSKPGTPKPQKTVSGNTTLQLLQLATKSPHAGVLGTHSEEHPGPAGFTLNFSVEAALQYGHFRDKKGFLTIAIASVKREKYSYLHQTIQSLLVNSSPSDKETVTIVIMFADDDQEWNDDRALNFSISYEEHVSSGHIQILTLPPQKYPDFNLLPRTYNDSVERLKWRSKQNIHYAFLFKFCHNISEYYLHLEDDVKTTKNYIQDIRKFHRIKTNDWFLIRFSNMGFIGVFFRSSNLLTISEFFLLFYAVQPCDFLMMIIANIQLQKKEIRHRPSLFQHHGIVSSLKNKRQIIIDKTFKGEKIVRRKKYYHINPIAELDTTMVVHEDYTAQKAYDISDKYFWAVSPQEGQTLTIVLTPPQTLTGIIIVGGFVTKKNDYIAKGEVQVSSSEQCSEWHTIGELKKGSFDTRNIPDRDKPDILNNMKNVTCVQVEVTKSQNNWAIISEIALLLESLPKV